MPPPRIAIGFDIHASWFLHTLQGLGDYWRTHGGWSMVRPLHTGVDALRYVEGVVVGDDRMAEAVRQTAAPCVRIGWAHVPLTVPRVAADIAESARRVADHFVERGIRQTVVFKSTHQAGAAHDRTQAFAEHARASGCTCRIFTNGPRTERVGRWFLEDQPADLGDLLHALPKPVGLMGADTNHAWRAHSAVQRAGLRMPDDVALASGGEDPSLFEATDPPITSVAQDTYTIGYRAGEVLHAVLRGEDAPAETLVSPREVIVRASSDVFAYDDEEVVEALRLIWSRVPDQLSIDDILDEVPVSKSTLIRRFKKVVGRTPGEEIKRSKVETAKRLLRTTDRPLAHVALDAGLGSQPMLNRYIKEATGLTPAQYRRQESM